MIIAAMGNDPPWDPIVDDNEALYGHFGDDNWHEQVLESPWLSTFDRFRVSPRPPWSLLRVYQVFHSFCFSVDTLFNYISAQLMMPVSKY